MRSGPHHVFRIIGGKSGLYGYMLLQTSKVGNYQNAYQGNQVQLTCVHIAFVSKALTKYEWPKIKRCTPKM